MEDHQFVDNNHLSICWFRRDLRLSDNPALKAATASGTVLPIYIHDPLEGGDTPPGAASRVWLHHSLKALDAALKGRLQVFVGDPGLILPRLVADFRANAVFWNRLYEPWAMKRDAGLKKRLQDLRITVESFNGSALFEPMQINKPDGTPYKVFTPFWRKGCLSAPEPRKSLDLPGQLICSDQVASAVSIDALGLLPDLGWGDQMMAHWSVGEKAAQDRFYRFIDQGLSDYKEGRNYPAKPAISRLSPHLHFGEISPHQIWHALKFRGLDDNSDHFLMEMGWREFSTYQLFHNPALPIRNLQRKFDDFPWRTDEESLHRWKQGKTGIPIIDAGMRELWQTGFMHNRVRMIVGSFLVKNLLIDWREGEAWFRDCLVDYDQANNVAGWQWIAGCGADAAPYFRIFNPVTQSERFDPDGDYIRHWLPELAHLPNRQLFAPWTADMVDQVNLPDHYRQPMVDLKQTRQRALDAWSGLGAAAE